MDPQASLHDSLPERLGLLARQLRESRWLGLVEPSATASPATGPLSQDQDRPEQVLGELLETLREQPPEESHKVAAREQLEAILQEEGRFLHGLRLSSSDGLDATNRMLVLERFRHHLDLWSLVAAELERRFTVHPLVQAQVSIDSIRGELNRSGVTDKEVIGNSSTPVLKQFEVLRGRVLRFAILDEIQNPIALNDAFAAWSRRFSLTEIIADLAASEKLDEPLTQMIDRHRDALAAAAQQSLSELPEGARHETLASLVELAREESNEIATFLEDIPVGHATSLINRLEQDLRTLSAQARTLVTPEDRQRPRKQRIIPLARALERMARLARSEGDEKHVAEMIELRFGKRMARALELTVLGMIFALAALLVVESTIQDRISKLGHEMLAWADLVICSILLAEFLLKTSLARAKPRYFFRHLLIDGIASIPFGFLTYQIQVAERLGGVEQVQWLRMFRFLRLPALARYLRLLRPLIRVGRLLLLSMRFADRLVARYAKRLNVNVVLFGEAEREPIGSGVDDAIASLKRQSRVDFQAQWIRASRAQHLEYAQRVVDAWDDRLSTLPRASDQTTTQPPAPKEIRLERILEQWIELTPEKLAEEMGIPFAESVHRFLGLFDLPLIRRLPLINRLLAEHDRGPLESTALAANYLGHLGQRMLDVVYFLADLAGTISAPLFLDRVGTTLESWTRVPAKRLFTLGFTFLGLWLLFRLVPALRSYQWFVNKFDNLIVIPVIAIGSICLVIWRFGAWLRRIANQDSDFRERIVEAHFATQTQRVKRRNLERDWRFLHERVLLPELELRRADEIRPSDRQAASPAIRFDPERPLASLGELSSAERRFGPIVEMLYLDYLDGPLFHRTDTKASMQLVGSMALRNLQSRRPETNSQATRIRNLDALDLTRGRSRLLGGPYVWFDYTTRLIAHETAKLLLEFNEHAIPLDRLQCCGNEAREGYRDWLASRLGVAPELVELPPVVGASQGIEAPLPPILRRGRGVIERLETVEFSALDFLSEFPEREKDLTDRYGEQLIELMRRERVRNIRRVFRGYPLERLPIAYRTINPFVFYRKNLASGWMLLFPFRLLLWVMILLVRALIETVRVIRSVLRGGAERPVDEPQVRSFATPLRKIHRMRKPAFMGSLWLRAEFDIAYLGLPLPSVQSRWMMRAQFESDLSFIGATRHERVLAEQFRRGQEERLDRVRSWLQEFGWTFPAITDFLGTDFPQLSSRGAEVIRALTTAMIIDHDGVETLARSILALRTLIVFGRDHQTSGSTKSSRLPKSLPPTVRIADLRRWGLSTRFSRRDLHQLLSCPEWNLGPEERVRVESFLKPHKQIVKGWLVAIRDLGGESPRSTLRARLLEVIRRSDLWSDQIVVLRTVQTLTMLDMREYCEMVWNLGKFDEIEDREVLGNLPFQSG